MEVLLNKTTVRYPLITMCDPSSSTVPLRFANDRFMLASPNYPKPYPRGTGTYCSLNVTLQRGMQMHLALIDLDLAFVAGLWAPLWKLHLLAYLQSFSSSAPVFEPELYLNQSSNYVVIDTETRNCTGEPDLFRITSSTYARPGLLYNLRVIYCTVNNISSRK